MKDPVKIDLPFETLKALSRLAILYGDPRNIPEDERDEFQRIHGSEMLTALYRAVTKP